MHLIRWGNLFGVPKMIYSDGGSHFKAELLSELEGCLPIDHHITTAYNPKGNGTVERMNREVLALFRSVVV